MINKGFDFEGARGKYGQWIELILSDRDMRKLQSMGYEYEVKVEDLQRHYASRLKNVAKGQFGDGSIGGFYTFDEMVAQLDSMKNRHPSLISDKIIIGYTVLNNPIYAVKISNNVDADDGDPEVFYNAMHHAREPQGMMTLIYYMWWLLDNYGNDPLATYIVNNRQLWFVPMINVDGYIHNYSTYPNGGGMWRKNARDNDNDGVHFSYRDGVDINRNYPIGWGEGNSSTDSTSDVYQGPAPFSEPELTAIKEFVATHDFKIAFNYHSYSNLYLFPWGYQNLPCPDDAYFRYLTSQMARENGYIVGRPGEMLYDAGGGAIDWEYTETGRKNKIFGITPEVGNLDDGFWPATDRILPLAQENLRANQIGALAAGAYPKISDINILVNSGSSAIYPGSLVSVEVELHNLGLQTAQYVMLSVHPHPSYTLPYYSSAVFPVISNRFLYPGLPVDEAPFMLQIAPDAAYESIPVILSVWADQFTFEQDTIYLNIGKEKILAFEEGFENGSDHWQQLQDWDIYSGNASEGSFSITDSPNGEYENNTINTLISQPISVREVTDLWLEYDINYQIEAGWDFVTVAYSVDNGNSWTPIITDNMVEGSENSALPSGQYGYSGNSNGWIHETHAIHLNQDSTIQLKFSLLSDGYVTADGIYLDNIKLYSLRNATNFPPMFFAETDTMSPIITDSTIVFRTLVTDNNIVDSVEFHWKIDEGDWNTGLMVAKDSLFTYSLDLKDLPLNCTISHNYTAYDDSGAVSYYPIGAPDRRLRYYLENPLSVQPDENNIPNQIQLSQNYPNPFNPVTTIEYSIPSDMKISLKIFNTRGQLIKTLKTGEEKAGTYQIQWDGTNWNGQSVSSGIYFYRLETPAGNLVKKLLFIK
ncbi:MAG: hypothetical protein Kow00108_26820 [Calditrichia bacterium]